MSDGITSDLSAVYKSSPPERKTAARTSDRCQLIPYHFLDERILAKALSDAAICTRSGLVLANGDLDGANRNALGETRQSLPCRGLVVRAGHCGNQQPPEQPPNDFGLSGFERPIQSKSFILLVPGGGVEPPRPCDRRILSPLRLPVPPSRPGHSSGPESGNSGRSTMSVRLKKPSATRGCTGVFEQSQYRIVPVSSQPPILRDSCLAQAARSCAARQNNAALSTSLATICGIAAHATMEAIVMTTASSAVVPEPVAVTPELLAQHSITAEEYERILARWAASRPSPNWAFTA